MSKVYCPLKPGLLCPAGRVCSEACICPLETPGDVLTMTYRGARAPRSYEHLSASEPGIPDPAEVLP